MKAHWQGEKEAIDAIRAAKEELEQAHRDAERAERDADLERAAQLRYGTIPELQERVTADEAQLRELQADRTFLKEEVDDEDVAEVVARWTNIPVSRLLESEVAKLVHMEERLHERVIGQDEAVEAVSNALRRSRAGLQDPDQPIGSFLFIGPTGVGKTELARALAEFMFDSQDAMVRIDMSEYMEKHSVSRLVGAPPGYVGYDEGGQLTEAVRRRPYSVVLLDEIEKAHADVFNVLLQLMDDGRLTDGQGRTVNFTNTVVIMTSNVPGGMAGVEATFKPEFVNRLDEVVEFASLTREQLGQIVELQADQLIARVRERGVEVELTDAAKELLGNLGYDPTYGARPLKRVIQKRLVDKLALKLLENEFVPGDAVRVDAAKASSRSPGPVWCPPNWRTPSTHPRVRAVTPSTLIRGLILALAIALAAPGSALSAVDSAVDDSVTIGEDDFPLIVDVLKNDDPPNPSVPNTSQISNITTPTVGSAEIEHSPPGNPDYHQIKYSAPLNYCGPVSFDYTGDYGTATVSMTITCVDDPPVAEDDPGVAPGFYRVDEDSGAVDYDVLANDTDVDGGPKLITTIVPPQFGAASLQGGKIRYTPPANFCGGDNVGYTLNNSIFLAQKATLSIDVSCKPDLPVANNDSLTVGFNSGTTFLNVLANDTDADNLFYGAANPEDIPIIGVTEPVNGTAAIVQGASVNTDQIAYTPKRDFCGMDSFIYRVFRDEVPPAQVFVSVPVRPGGVAAGRFPLRRRRPAPRPARSR